MRSPEAKNILWYRTTAVLKEPKLQQLTKIEAKWTQAQMLEAKAQETARLPSPEALFMARRATKVNLCCHYLAPLAHWDLICNLRKRAMCFQAFSDRN